MCPTDSNGNYTLPAGYLAVTGNTILASQHNPPLEDVAEGLTARVMRNGSAPMSGALKMGSNKITGLADGTVDTDAASFGQMNAAITAATVIVRTTHGDSDHTLTEDDRDLVVDEDPTAARTWTLLPADTFDAGAVVRISDPSGLVTTTYPLSIAADGSDTINGGTAALIVGPRFELELITDGVSNWQAVLEGPTNATWLASGETAAAASQDIPLQPFIARGYRKFFLKLRNIRPATDDAPLLMRLSADNAATFLTTGYQWGVTLSDNGDNTVYSFGDTNDDGIYLGLSLSNANNERSRFGINMECATDNFDLLAIGCVFSAGNGVANYTNSGYLAQPVNGLQIKMTSGNITSMNWSLYGVA